MRSSPPGHRAARPRTPRLNAPAISHATLGVVSIALGISPSVILSSSRCAAAVYGRQLAMYLLNTTFRMTHSHIGRALGRDRTTASYACRIIEDLRDDPSVETVLTACEASLEGLRELAAHPTPAPRRRRALISQSSDQARAQ